MTMPLFDPYTGRQLTYQEMLNYQQLMQQPQQQPAQPVQQTVQTLQGEAISGEDDLKSKRPALDGTKSIYPDFANGIIYVKYLDDNCLPVTERYVMQAPPAPPEYAETKEVQSIEERVAKIEQLLNGVMKSVKSENAANATGNENG